MDKNKKRKSSEKQFINTMIITGAIGISVMMITMLYVIKIFGDKKVTVNKEDKVVLNTLKKEDESKEKVETSNIKGVIYEKKEGKGVRVWSIKDEEYIEIKTDVQTNIQDAYTKPMTEKELQVGDSVDITYDLNTRIATIIQKSAESWSKTGINDTVVDITNRTITIGNEKYNYTSNIIVTNFEGEFTEINSIGKYDVLDIKGSGKTIWSIQITQSPGYINLVGAPTTEGTIEIDNNRIYMIADIKENIPLSPGKHKVVIQLKGYAPISETVEIVKDTVHNLELKDIKQVVTNLTINVTNTAEEYIVQINNKRYKKGEAIEVPSGTHVLKISASGFELYEQKLELESGNQLVEVTLKPKEIVSEDNKEEKPNNPKDTNNPKETNKDEDKDINKEEVKTVQIILETEPAGAQVFVNGVHKGTTPAMTGLKPGEYNVTIEKEGYQALNTIIIVDGGSAQRAFLYTLQKE